MPSKEAKGQGTFTEVYILPYSLIAFYGIANENLAQITQMTEDDLELILEAMWNGTKNLISRSKVGQMPRLLLDIEYQENNFHLGDLDKYIKLETNVEPEAIRDISEVKINLSSLLNLLNENAERIKKIRWAKDERLNSIPDLNEEELKTTTQVKLIEELNF